MIYQKIWFDGTTVRLRFLEQLDGAKDAHEYECAEAPTGAFKGSLAAFAPFVVNLLGLPLDWADCDVRSLALKREEKTNARGVQVTVMRKIANAKNRPVTITTPYLAEAPDAYNGDGVGYLDEIVLKLIDEAERQAELYRTGERGEQMKLSLDASDNVREFDDRAASAEVASTRKPKGKGKRGADAVEPEPIAHEVLRQLLLQVERSVDVEAIAAWSGGERSDAREWAVARLEEMVGQRAEAMVPREPTCVVKAATLALKADAWTSDEPVRVGADAAQAIAAAAERGD